MNIGLLSKVFAALATMVLAPRACACARMARWWSQVEGVPSYRWTVAGAPRQWCGLALAACISLSV